MFYVFTYSVFICLVETRFHATNDFHFPLKSQYIKIRCRKRSEHHFEVPAVRLENRVFFLRGLPFQNVHCANWNKSSTTCIVRIGTSLLLVSFVVASKNGTRCLPTKCAYLKVSWSNISMPMKKMMYNTDKYSFYRKSSDNFKLSDKRFNFL